MGIMTMALNRVVIYKFSVWLIYYYNLAIVVCQPDRKLVYLTSVQCNIHNPHLNEPFRVAVLFEKPCPMGTEYF